MKKLLLKVSIIVPLLGSTAYSAGNEADREYEAYDVSLNHSAHFIHAQSGQEMQSPYANLQPVEEVGISNDEYFSMYEYSAEPGDEDAFPFSRDVIDENELALMTDGIESAPRIQSLARLGEFDATYFESSTVSPSVGSESSFDDAENIKTVRFSPESFEKETYPGIRAGAICKRNDSLRNKQRNGTVIFSQTS